MMLKLPHPHKNVLLRDSLLIGYHSKELQRVIHERPLRQPNILSFDFQERGKPPRPSPPPLGAQPGSVPARCRLAPRSPHPAEAPVRSPGAAAAALAPLSPQGTGETLVRAARAPRRGGQGPGVAGDTGGSPRAVPGG